MAGVQCIFSGPSAYWVSKNAKNFHFYQKRVQHLFHRPCLWLCVRLDYVQSTAMYGRSIFFCEVQMACLLDIDVPLFPSLLFHVVRSDVLCKNEFFASVMFDCICDMARLHPMHCKWAPDKMQEFSLSIEHLFLCLCLGFLSEKYFLSVYFGDGCNAPTIVEREAFFVLDMQWTFNSTCMLLWIEVSYMDTADHALQFCVKIWFAYNDGWAFVLHIL